MKLLKWLPGRQGTDYKKLPIWSFKIYKFGFDCYILKLEDGVIPEHTDPVNNGKHYRLNLCWGVTNFCYKDYDKGLYRRFGKFIITAFRPDINPHSAYIFEKTTILSLGFVKFKK